MPRQTFFNLPIEKKQTLIQAAKKEFSRAPLSDASIANIVKEAEIPRGSFYQYFDDKEDLYFFLLNEHAKERQAEFIVTIQKNNGDIIKSITEAFHEVLKEIESGDTRNFYRNVFLNLNYKTEKAFLSNFNMNAFNKQYTEIKHLINTEKLNVTDEEEVYHIVQIFATVMMQNLVQKSAKNLSNDDVIQNFTMQVNLLCKGFMKNTIE